MHVSRERRPSHSHEQSTHALIFVVLVALILLLLMALAPRSAGAHVRARVIASFEPGGQFPEGLARLHDGRLAVSVTTWGPTTDAPSTGQVWAIDRKGHRTAMTPILSLGGGLLTGIAVDRHGDVYVGHATYDATTVPGVFVIANGRASRLADLPVGSFPNGLAVRGHDVYVSDSALGVIWRLSRQRPPVVVVRDELLAPSPNGIGANGIALHDGVLDVAVSDAGRVVRIPFWHGRSGTPRVLAEDPRMAGADGILVGRHGTLYVTSDTNDSIVRVGEHGHVRTVARGRDGLLYPTSLVWSGRGERSPFYVLNGDFLARGTPTLIELWR